MKIGYCRVSTDDQNPDLQLAALKRAGCKRIFTDKASGAHVKQPQLAKCLASLQTGDVLVVWKLDRLGRSLHDLITLLDDLKARGVKIGRKPLLSAQQVAHARKLREQGESPAQVAQLLNVLCRTLERALRNSVQISKLQWEQKMSGQVIPQSSEFTHEKV
jgi:DNA invertase Pin-like site-specific DNA recombinase